MLRVRRFLSCPAVLICGWMLVTAGCDDSPLPPASTTSSSSSEVIRETQELPVDLSTRLIGKRPPPIKVAKWIKGEPLQEFEHGKVYVVDFWATWCSPCIAAIPHLTKLAREHKGKLEVVGISISERQKSPEDTSYIDDVAQFVSKKGDRMDYRVAVDTPDKQMHSTWFKPCGTAGIPTAYIIDQNGLVAWTGIGNPLVIERIANEVLAGTFDPRKEAELQKKLEVEADSNAKKAALAAKNASLKTDESFPGYDEAMKTGDTATALAILNEAFANDPSLETAAAYQWKFMLLMQRGKPAEVNAYVQELLERYPSNGDVIGFASACIVATSEESRFDNQLAFEVARKTVELEEPNSRFAQFAKWRLAWAYFHIGDRVKAIESVQLALEGINRLQGNIDFGDLAIQCEDALKVFQTPTSDVEPEK